MGRAIDFSVLLVTLRLRNRLPALRALRKMTFVELGPGPMRMATLKRLVFRQVLFIDQCDFGIPDQELRIANLEQCGDAQNIIKLCGSSSNEHGFFLFADHCLEHLTREAAVGLLGSLAYWKFTACFRVPNIESLVGKRNFAGDPTHHSAFDDEFRTWLSTREFIISPWIRWYRSSSLFRLVLTRAQPMHIAEEIVVTGNFS